MCIFYHFSYLSAFSQAEGTSDLLLPRSYEAFRRTGFETSSPLPKHPWLRSRATSGHRLQHLPFQAHTDLLKNFQGHADIVKLLPAFVDILQARHHEIPVGKKNGLGLGDFGVAALPPAVGARPATPRQGERAPRHHWACRSKGPAAPPGPARPPKRPLTISD